MESASKKAPAQDGQSISVARRIRIDAPHQPVRRPWLSLLKKR